MNTPKTVWSYGWRILLLAALFVFIVIGATITAEHLDRMSKVTEMNARARVPEGHAEFEVLLGSKNAGDAIYAVLRVKDEDIPKFFEGYAWTLLPPPLPGGDK